MSKLLNAVKEKFLILKQNTMLRTVLICVLALLLIFSVTLAWYINNLGLWGMEFSTGNINFNAYVYDTNGKRLVGPLSPEDKAESDYINAPLFSIQNAQVGSTGTVYIAVESTGSIGIQYRIAFDVTGKNESAIAYLGGYKYKVTKVTDKVAFSGGSTIDVSRCSLPEKIDDEIVTIDRNSINGTIEQHKGYDIYRFDYTLANKNEEYTSNTINFYLNIFATQIGGDFENTNERGNIYYCSSKEDLDRARVEAYPGDLIKLTSNIIYYGDLVFNKPVSLETNDFTLTVNGNLMYDYVLGNDLKLDAGGLGQIVVKCTKEGVGGNLKIKAPLSNVTLIGSNASSGDFIVEKTITVDATNSFGAAGVSFNNVRIVDEQNSRKTILLESNTRATVSFGTTIGLLQTVVKANNIEIVNNGVISDLNLSNMGLLDQTNSPQIYILNNNDIDNPITLPEWSVKFVQDENGKCTGNTRIIQSYSGSPMLVQGTCVFDNDDIEVEKNDALVEQIIPGNDCRLKIYYQDVDGEVTSIQSILENYLQNVATTGCSMNEILQLDIISVGTKAITNADIAFMNSTQMLSLKHLDMQRAHIYDTATGTRDRLPNNAFEKVQKYEVLVLPQNLTAIGDNALASSKIENPVTVPAGVTTFGQKWFSYGKFVSFASSVPEANAVSGMNGVTAIFVEEAYIESYRSVYNQYNAFIYPVSVLDESKEHFVRNIRGNEWEITYHVRGEDKIIGKNVTMDGEILNITSVYDNAYRHNFTLSEVRFDDSVTHLGAYNFYTNKNIAYVDLNNIKTIGDNVFDSCKNLSEVVFSDKLEELGVRVFAQCTALAQEVVLPPTMKSIGEYCFTSTPITYFDAGGTTRIENHVLYACNSLVAADLSNVVEVVSNSGNELFCYCSNLVSVDFSSLGKVSGSRMFKDCKSLREIYMGSTEDGVSLGSYPFVGVNTKLLKLYVPDEAISFYKNRAIDGINVNSIYPKGEKMDELLVNGFNIGKFIVLNNGDDTYTLVTSNLQPTGEFVVPNTYGSSPITKIYSYAFTNQTFTDVEVTLGDSLKDIGMYAFYGLKGLLKVNFGKGLENVGEYAFANCTGLSQDVVLPDTMKTIGYYAFTYTGITSVNAGGTVTLYDHIFDNCRSLIHAEFPAVKNVKLNSNNNELFAYCTSLVSVSFPRLEEVAGSRLFSYCTSLREIYMGSKNVNVTLGSVPFANINSNLLKLYVPEDLVSFYCERGILPEKQIYAQGEKLGDESLNGFVLGDYIMLKNDTGYTLVTSNLSFSGTVELPTEYKGQPVTKIGERAFMNQSFTNVSLILGESVTEISYRAFNSRSGLTAITMDGVTTIGAEAFSSTGLKVLNLPALTSVGDSAFKSCTSLTVANLPAIEKIEGASVFVACSALKVLYFENLMKMTNTSLQHCTALENITINRLIESDGSNMPSEFTIEKSAPCKIYVPYRALTSYPSTWSGKPVVSFDTTLKVGSHTYILTKTNEGKFAVIDFMPGSSVASLTLPATVSVDGASVAITGIREGAFTTVSNTLKTITLSANTAQLSYGALKECALLENINVDSNNPYFKSVSGVLYTKDGKMLVKYPAGRSGKFDMTAGNYNGTVSIGATAFANAVKLTEIIFPASLTVIDGGAFDNCIGLHTVQFKGTTPPILLGSGIFDTSVDEFKMLIPSGATAYLTANNFNEYQTYITEG